MGCPPNLADRRLPVGCCRGVAVGVAATVGARFKAGEAWAGLLANWGAGGAKLVGIAEGAWLAAVCAWLVASTVT